MAILLNTGTGTGGVGTSTVALTINGYWQPNVASPTAELVDYLLTNFNATPTVQPLNLTSGNNTINATNCPAISNAAGVAICPPSGNGVTISLKGISADTGIPISIAAPTVLQFSAAPPSSFVLTTNNPITALLLVWF